MLGNIFCYLESIYYLMVLFLFANDKNRIKKYSDEGQYANVRSKTFCYMSLQILHQWDTSNKDNEELKRNVVTLQEN